MPAAKPTTLITVIGSHESGTHANTSTVAPVQTEPAQPAAPPMASLPYKCTDDWQVKHPTKSKPKKCAELVAQDQDAADGKMNHD